MTDQEINAAVAVEVMGWVLRDGYWVHPERGAQQNVTRWEPLTQIWDAWRVVERMRKLGFAVQITSAKTDWLAHFTRVTDDINELGTASTAPRAVALAALAAVRANS